jgi:hypothetical protein
MSSVNVASAHHSSTHAPGGTDPLETVQALGNLGASKTLTLGSISVMATGTLTANCALTVAGLTAGCSVVLLLSQDGTGGRTLTINGASVTIPLASGSVFDVLLWSPDGTNLYVQPGPQTGATGAAGATGATGATGAAGTNGIDAADNGRLTAWGAKSVPYPVALAANNSTLTSGRIEGALIGVQPGMVLTGIVIGLSTNAASLDGLYACLYNTDTNNTLLTTSPQNQPTALNSGTASTGNLIQLPFFSGGATYTVPAGVTAVYACILAHGTTPPAIGRGANTGWVNAINGGRPLFVMNTGNTTPPSPTIGAGNWNQENTSYWIGVY